MTSRQFTATTILVLVSGSFAFGESQTIQFDLKSKFGNGDGTPYLYSVSNAQLFTESIASAGFPTYWEPTTSNVTAAVVYKLHFPFSIQTATLNTLINVFFNTDPNSSASLDVSPDGANWTNIFLADTSLKDSIRGKRYRACLNTNTLERILLSFAVN